MRTEEQGEEMDGGLVCSESVGVVGWVVWVSGRARADFPMRAVPGPVVSATRTDDLNADLDADDLVELVACHISSCERSMGGMIIDCNSSFDSFVAPLGGSVGCQLELLADHHLTPLHNNAHRTTQKPSASYKEWE